MNGSGMRLGKKSKTSWKQMKMNSQQPKTTAKAVLRGKFIAIQAYLKKIETLQTNNLTLCLQGHEEKQLRHPEQAEGRK